MQRHRRGIAFPALASIKDPRVIDALAPMLTDVDWQLRHAALAAISTRAAASCRDGQPISERTGGHDEAVLALCALLEIEQSEAPGSPIDAAHEASALVAIPVMLDEAAAAQEQQQEQGQEQGQEQAPAALNTLEQILADNEHVAHNIGPVLDVEDAERLASADIKPRRRKHVALEPDTTPALDAARFAARSLGECPSPAARAALEQALDWHDEQVRTAALRSLQRIYHVQASGELLDRLAVLAHSAGEQSQVCATRLLMQLEDARGLQRCQAFLQSAEVSICRALLQHTTQLALPIDQSLEEDVVALFRIEPLRPLALKAIAVIKPTRVIDHLVPLIAGGDEGVHQALGTMLRRRELAAQPAARALLAGLDDPQWARERLWVLEMLERLVQPA